MILEKEWLCNRATPESRKLPNINSCSGFSFFQESRTISRPSLLKLGHEFFCRWIKIRLPASILKLIVVILQWLNYNY